MRKANGAAGSRASAPVSPMSAVETNAQLLSGANSRRSSVSAVPIAHSPRPGGRNFIWKMRSNMSRASACAAAASHGSRCSAQCRCCIRNVPFTTRAIVSPQRSWRPSARAREYVRRYTSSPRPLNPNGGGSRRHKATKCRRGRRA